MKRWPGLALRLLVGGLFVWAGALKVLDPAGFATDISNYRLLPAALVNLVAIILPWVELVAGALLMAGWWQRPSAAVIALLMGVFLVAIGAALLRGLDVNCGCFGTAHGRKAGLATLLQDVALLAAALRVWWQSPREKQP